MCFLFVFVARIATVMVYIGVIRETRFSFLGYLSNKTLGHCSVPLLSVSALLKFSTPVHCVASMG